HNGPAAALLPTNLVIEICPANCTSFMQPADMGMIARLKIGYKALMLRKLLAICDDQELYEETLMGFAATMREMTKQKAKAWMQCC
ncbi:MAG: hypothetical protein ACREOZ_00495, partial [Gloeomargaritales cyanobacterium]